ncbi:MAG: hypothetical protein QXF41_03390 [Candidatus Micrarchaeaceae archaeon]
MDRCYLCDDEAYFYSGYLRQNLCKKHFEKMLIRRIRGEVASRGFSRRKYKLVPDGSIGYKLNSFMFKPSKDADTAMDNLLLDDFALAVLKHFVTKEKIDIKINGENYFNPLYLISKEEAIAFLRLKKMDYAENKGGDADLVAILDRLEAKRPGAKISMVKSGIRAGLI